MLTKEHAKISKVIYHKPTGKAVGFLGRDGEIYPIVEDTIMIYHDKVGDPWPYSLIYISNNIVEQCGIITEEDLRTLNDTFTVKMLDSDSNTTH